MTKIVDTLVAPQKPFDWVIIDGDPLVYRCGYAIESTNELGMVTVEPVKHAFYNINSMIKQCLKLSGTDKYKIYLSERGKKNFRFEIYKYYKENRVKCSEKCDNPHPYDCGHSLIGKRPVWYAEIREYIIKRWEAEIVPNIEADDSCSIAQHQFNNLGFDKEDRNSITWSFDKDFNNFPGWHGNYLTKEIYYITPIEALRNFYLQILTGDDSDNIPRVKYRWLKKKTFEKLQKLDKEEDMYYTIIDEAKKCFEDEKDAYKFVVRNGRLVHLLKELDVMWNPPIMSVSNV